MQNLKVSILQYDILWEQKEENFKNITALLKKKEQTDLLVLPEMFSTGFSMNTKLAEDMNGKGVNFLKSIANKHNFVAIGSLLIKENNRVFNRAVACNKDGVIGYYDKKHLFSMANEDEYFSAGENTIEFSVNGWVIRPQICYDLRFPESARNTSDYDLLIYTANWPKKRKSHWDVLLKARAIENQCYVAACNRIGQDAKGIEYNGSSQIIDYKGNVLQSNIDNEGFIEYTLDKNSMIKWRNEMSALADMKINKDKS